ncbi:unnamed protein product [Withania somnifera]
MAASARRSTGPVLRSLSPAGKLYSSSSTSSIRFTVDRETSPNQSISVINRQKKTCMCSPTNHPGSFRCSMHKKMDVRRNSSRETVSYDSNSIRLHMRRSAMTNSIVRIGSVEGELVKRSLAALIRPSSHQQRRRVHFQRRPSRLSFVS